MMARELVLTAIVPGNPMPAPRARAGQGRHYMPQSYVDHREAIAYAMLLTRGAHRPVDRHARFALACAFYRDSERSFDLDNGAKTVMDAGQLVVWPNDSQIVELMLRKAVDRDQPRTWVRVWRLDPAQEVLA